MTMKAPIAWYNLAVDARPLAFLRICFGFLMIVYSANKCTDDLANKKVDDMVYPFEHRVPSWLHHATQAFPYFTNSHLYWHLHAPLMLLSAAGMAMAFGALSRLSCVCFAVLKHVLTLQDQTNYNNHEYLYALIALVLGLLGGHDAILSFLGKAAISAAHGLHVPPSEEEEAGGAGEGSAHVWTCLGLSLSGALYMSLNNAVYGIAGHIAWVGVTFLVVPGAVLLLGAVDLGEGRPGYAAKPATPASRVLRRKRVPAAAADMNISTNSTGSTPDGTDAYTPPADTSCSPATATVSACALGKATVPFWHVLFLRVFFSTVYLFAGFAKTDFDWCSGLTVGELFRLWTGPTASAMLRDTILKISVGAGNDVSYFVVGVLAYGGLCLDLGCAVLLNASHWPTKMFATLTMALFHVLNHTNFVIETFPWVMLCALTVHHDAVWIDRSCAAVNTILYKFMHAKEMIGVTVRVLSQLLVPVLLILMVMHLVIPLPCALHTVMDDGSLAWGSQCSFFRWRMMTRSVRTISSQLRFQDPNTGRTDHVPMTSAALYPDVARVKECTMSSSLERYGFERNQALNRFLHEVGSYEDRVAYVVRDALLRVQPALVGSAVGAAPHIFADVWIEVNGPPAQRYIDSAVDLASKNASLVSTPPIEEGTEKIVNMFRTFIGFFSRPQPLAPWVLPRLMQFRTQDWIQRYRILEGLVARKHLQVEHPHNRPQVLFLADHCDKGLLRIDSRFLADAEDTDGIAATVELVLLSGEAEIVNLDKALRVSAGSCIKVQGALSLRTISSSGSPSLWMIVARTETGFAHGGSRVIANGGPPQDENEPGQQPEWLAVGDTNKADVDSTSKTFDYCISVPVL